MVIDEYVWKPQGTIYKQIFINHLNRTMNVQNIYADVYRKYLPRHTGVADRNSNVYIFMQNSKHFLLME